MIDTVTIPTLLRHMPFTSARALRRPYPGLTAPRLLEVVSHVTDVPVVTLKGACRVRDVSRARMFAYWRLRRDMELSLHRISQMMGDRDHTTILHGLRRWENDLAATPMGRRWTHDYESIVSAESGVVLRAIPHVAVARALAGEVVE